MLTYKSLCVLMSFMGPVRFLSGILDSNGFLWDLLSLYTSSKIRTCPYGSL